MADAPILNDPHIWLEDVEGEKALAQVRQWNDRSLAELESDPRYKEIEPEIRKVVLATDRIPYGAKRGDYIYNFWQDDKNVRGLWRRTPLAEYRKAEPKWEVLLDIDELAKKENENWVWAGSSALPPDFNRCMISLSRGGADAKVVREYDIAKGQFIEDGFNLPEAKQDVSWYDRDRVLVSTDFGPGTMTKSGYARQLRIWKRGEPLASAKLIHEVGENDMAISGWVNFLPGKKWAIVYQMMSFFASKCYLLRDDLTLAEIPVPEDFHIENIHDDRLFGIPRLEWKTRGQTIAPGTLVSMSLTDLQAAPEVVHVPDKRSSVLSVFSTKSHLYMIEMRNVRAKLYELQHGSAGWSRKPVALPDTGTLSPLSADDWSDHVFFDYSDFLVADSVVEMTDGEKTQTIKSLPSRFDASKLAVDQFEAKSSDGESIPYFVIRPKDMKLDGKNPTLLYGYGGFNSSLTPYYLASNGKIWCGEGGVYVIANIRGGGEFGPSWHEAGRLKNRQLVYDDFIAVAEDLIARKITSPKHLGTMGGSNGGLLMGVMLTQRPDLFSAVVCQVPLLDMIRYHKLLAGHSWMDEYGDPDDPEMREVILKYSPYQNLKKGAKYPRIFFMTSTRDDRVHPGHARKMAARMEEMGHPFLYYENIEGGHGGAANLEQRIKFNALQWTYLWKLLGNKTEK